MTDIRIERVTRSGEGVERFRRDLKKRAFIKVGILSGTGEHPKGTSGQTVAEVAWWNEFGTRKMKARPFLRTALREHITDYRAILTTVLRNITLQRMTVEQGLGLLGVKAVRDIQEKITQLHIIDTGALRQHINWAELR